MTNILFVDAVCPKPYSHSTLTEGGLGGSEATCLRVASLLNAPIWQRGRKEAIEGFPSDLEASDAVRHVVVLRSPMYLSHLAALYKKARFYLWLHDFVDLNLVTAFPTFRYYGVTLICVSQYHKNQVEMVLAGGRCDLSQIPPIRVIYNPVDACPSSDAVVDRNKLVFFSSPHKGLINALRIFAQLKSIEPEMTLTIANPGYYNSYETPANSGITNIGSVPHREVLKHVQEALCVFYPNTVFPETFGLVLAEANAVATPVLAHTFGAAPEILQQDMRQLVDCRDSQKVIETVLHWRKSGNRPIVHLDERFAIATLEKQWHTLLHGQNRGRV